MQAFNYKNISGIDFRKHPECYQIGRGEQGVLMVEPYKSEILPHWRFKTPAVARVSAHKIYGLFLGYKKQKDFVGMDMSRKFLQMGYTRARRYANHPSGRKYAKQATLSKSHKKSEKVLMPQSEDWNTNEKAESAKIFYSYYIQARENPSYKKQKKEWGKN